MKIMKNFIKGFFFGLIISILIVPAFADNLPLFYNQIRICIDGLTAVNYDENLKNSSAPSSILYQDTTYVPLRFISEKMNKDVVWNGDSKTVGITDKINNSTVIAEKPDLNGHIWTYSILSDKGNAKYLSIKDKERGFERRYDIRGKVKNSYRMTDEAIWIVTKGGYLYKIAFLSDENSQDGEKLRSFWFDYSAAFDDKYLYVAHGYGGTAPRDRLYAINLDTLEESDSQIFPSSESVHGVTLINSDANEAILNFYIYGATGYKQPEKYEIKFDKINFTLSKAILINDE